MRRKTEKRRRISINFYYEIIFFFALTFKKILKSDIKLDE